MSVQLTNIKNVKIGIEFNRIGDIDTMNETYKANIKIQATWEENRKIEKYNAETDWNPSLFIENILQQNECTTKYDVDFNILTNSTKITQTQIIKGK